MSAFAGKYYVDVLAGRVFIGSTAAAGTAFPISTGTAVTFALWNNNPGYNAVPLWFTGGYTSGTIALGTLGLADQNVGYALGTAAPLSVFTNATPKNALVGGPGSQMRFTGSAATLTAGGTALMQFGTSIESATAGLGLWTWKHDFDGSIIVPPGHMIFVCGSVAQTALFTMSLCWAEIPA